MSGLLGELTWLSEMTWPWQAVVKLMVAALLGAIVGFEREFHGRSAGLRTQLLVALGASLAMIVSLRFADVFGSVSSLESLRIDPARLAYGVMAGVGFLGAGAIIQDRTSIRGLTTAASLWCTAAVGLACGFGMLLTAAFATLVVVFALLVLNRLERVLPYPTTRSITLTVPLGSDKELQKLEDRIAAERITISGVSYKCDLVNDLETVTFRVRMPRKTHPRLLKELVQDLPGAIALKVQ